jgi:exodeoxyribonuclease V alpha subunit
MLASLAQKLLEVDAALIERAIAEELQRAEEVISDTVGGETCIFLKCLHAAERVISERLIARSKRRPPWPAIDLDRALPWVEGKTAKTLSASQREAVRAVLSSSVSVMTGGPGVGKTSTLDSILRILVAKGVGVFPASRVGRQADDRADGTRRRRHRLEIDLKMAGLPNRGELRDRVVDEIDGRSVMNAPPELSPSTRLLLVGDVIPALGRARAGLATYRIGTRPVPAPRRCSAGGGEPNRGQRPPDQPRPNA